MTATPALRRLIAQMTAARDDVALETLTPALGLSRAALDALIGDLTRIADEMETTEIARATDSSVRHNKRAFGQGCITPDV